MVDRRPGFFRKHLGRINKADVAESLGEISKLTPIFGIVFLREKADIIAQIEQALEKEPGILLPADQMQAIRQPEGTWQKGAFVPRQAIDLAFVRPITQNESVLQ